MLRPLLPAWALLFACVVAADESLTRGVSMLEEGDNIGARDIFERAGSV